MAKKKTKESPVESFKNEQELVKRWHDRVAVSLRYRDSVAQEQRWEEFIKEYENEYDVKMGHIKVPPINEVYAYIQASISGLYFRDPYITVNPKRGGSEKGAAILESAVNYYWKELGVKEEIELEIMDAGLVGHAWHKDGIMVVTEQDGERLKLKAENLYSTRVSWRDIVFNIGTRRPPKDCLWMAQRIIKPLDDVKAAYANAAGLKGVYHPCVSKDSRMATMYKDDIMFAVLWEIWDARSKQVLLIAEGHDRILKKGKWPDYLDEFPFKMLWYNAIPDKPYPMSDIAPWEPQIKEKIKLFAQALNHVKRWNRQIFIKKGVVPPSEMEKFEKGIDGAIIEHTGDSVNPEPVDFGSLPTDVYSLLDRIDSVSRSVNGQPEFDKGGTTVTKTRTLGELELMKHGAKTRTDRKLDRVETHLESIAGHIIAHIKANFDVEKVVKISGEPTEEVIAAFGPNYDHVSGTVKFSKDDIVGEYETEVKAGSTLAMDKTTRIQILQTVLETLATVSPAASSSPFLKEIIIELLRDYDIAGLKRAFEEEVAVAQAAAEAAAEQGNAEEAKTVAEAEKRKAQANQIDVETAALEQQLTMPLAPSGGEQA